jgi:hypothetical protein
MVMNQIPKAFEKSLLNDEIPLAVTKKHSLWIIVWLFKPKNLMISFFTFGLVILYKLYLSKYEIIIITNKRIIGSVNPKLLTKDKIDLTLSGIDNIEEDETIFGNIFGWVSIQIKTRSGLYIQNQVTKESVKLFKSELYDLKN